MQQESGFRIQESEEKVTDGEPRKGWLLLLEYWISARNSWILNPSILNPIELFRLS